MRSCRKPRARERSFVVTINREPFELIAARVEGLLEQRELIRQSERILNRVAHLNAEIRRTVQLAPPVLAGSKRMRSGRNRR